MANDVLATERKFVGLTLDAVEADGVFSGYASLFGRLDLGKDIVERGAFSASLKKRGASGIRMLFQHDPKEPIFGRGYLVVDRTGVKVLRDPYSAKPYVLFYTTKRVGGGVQDFDAIKLLKFATA